MSRIEEALDKATRARDRKDGGFAPAMRPLDTGLVLRPEKISPCITALKDPGSPISEEYRKLKSMVVKMTKHGGLNNTLMVTSSLGGEGKSITAINLAVVLAQEYDHTVLLVDADTRNPSIHRYLGVSSEIGFTDCLLDGLDVGAAMLHLNTGKFAFLPSGRRVKDPAELLASQKMRAFIDEVKHRYSDRYVIIDTPPVLPFSDASSVGSIVDGVVFVVGEGAASLQNIGEALDILGDGNVLGIVYNNASLEGLYGHYHYYYYGRERHGEPGKA